jgi:H+/Cl- antiporter ClcA
VALSEEELPPSLTAGPRFGETRRLVVSLSLGAAAGLIAGVSGWAFLEMLDATISFREDTAPWLLWLLPVGAFVIAAAMHHWGGRSKEGTKLVVGAARGTEPGLIPARMSVFILFGTLAGHFFGASVGREGAAVQITGSIAETLARPLRLEPQTRRTLLVACIAGGFGALFGVPLAGTVFALEIAWRGRRWHDVVPVGGASLLAGSLGHWFVGALGHEQSTLPRFDIDVGPWMLVRVVAAGLAFGLAAWMFRQVLRWVKRLLSRIAYPPFRAAVAGAAIVGATLIVGRASLSLSLPVGDHALNGDGVTSTAWLSKLSFTAVSLGGGLPGGDVTPLFVTGAALGATLAKPLSIAQGALASIGFVSVFGAAARTPIATVVLAAELFGPRAIIPTAVAAIAALASRGQGGLYEFDPSQPANATG